MNTYQYDEESVKALVDWARNAEFPASFCLTDSENIVDVKKYVIANIYDIEGHYPNVVYRSAITRLYRLKEALEQA